MYQLPCRDLYNNVEVLFPLVTPSPGPEYPGLHPRVAEVTARIVARSRDGRAAWLERVERARSKDRARAKLGCTNLAHAIAASGPGEKQALRATAWANIGIVSSYNDMLSAHQPFERFPALIKMAAREAGAVAQFAGGVPAMCDGVTQGMPGMELSLFSRDVIAMATAVALTHDVFDAALCLGICDKIVPGLLIGALSFAHLPVIFVPGGPMPSGMPNQEKARIRQLFAQGKVDRQALLESEMQSYHGAGTCTFYGTANSNQALMEVMGLHLPGAAFVSPNTPLARCAHARSGAPRGGDHGCRATTTGRCRRWWTRNRSSMPSSPCWPPAAPPTTRSISSRSRSPRASSSTGMISAICRMWCRCWRASTRTAAPT